METLVAACGLVCSKCPAFIGTRTGNDDIIRQTAEEWTKLYGVDISPESVRCSGCMTEGGPKCTHCFHGCEIRACVLKKHYDTCADCAEYPCAKNTPIISGVPAAKTLLEALKIF